MAWVSNLAGLQISSGCGSTGGRGLGCTPSSRGDKTPQPRPLCAGSAKPLPPFQDLLRDGAEGEGIKKKNILKLSKQTPSTPTGRHQGWGDKSRCRIGSWCKLDASGVKRRKTGRTRNPPSYNVDNKPGIRVQG